MKLCSQFSMHNCTSILSLPTTTERIQIQIQIEIEIQIEIQIELQIQIQGVPEKNTLIKFLD